MKLTLIRFAYLPDVTLGWLVVEGRRFATLEEPWRADPDGPGGQKKTDDLPASCVPDGDYQLVPHSGATKKDVWAMVNPKLGVYHWPAEIPNAQKFGRFGCLIHVGNSTRDIEGCIALGTQHARQGNLATVYDSLKSIIALREVLGLSSTHALSIRPTAGTEERG